MKALQAPERINITGTVGARKSWPDDKMGFTQVNERNFEHIWRENYVTQIFPVKD